jgi:hypothetical protein
MMSTLWMSEMPRQASEMLQAALLCSSSSSFSWAVLEASPREPKPFSAAFHAGELFARYTPDKVGRG